MALTTKTVYVVQEGPANALATNRDATQVAIAGRNVFKIFTVEDEELVEKLNLRVGKYINLNYSCADVVWNPGEDSILATAATNGAVVTWNLNKPSRSKQDMVFQDHKRTVNKVSFHPMEPNILISGSQDGTMKNFDLRRKEVTNTFYSNSESVRDVQFSPHQYFVFAAVQENGNVQLWDLRRTDRYERQFTGHNGPVFACDWHPENRWLATAGRDKTIKVWDLESRPVLEHTIHAIASVARIKWRPQKKYDIASSSLVVDFSVNIWDVRRPYIPSAAFNEHKDVTTGIAWRNSPDVFLSTSKDCTLYQHSFQDAVRPAERANPMGLDINSSGDILLAASNRILNSYNHVVSSGKSMYSATTRLPAIFRKGPNLGDRFPDAVSSCCVMQNRFEKNLSVQWLVESAKQYRLAGYPFTEMCDHNAAVAMNLDRPLVSQTWSMLKLLYSNSTSAIPITTAEVIRQSVVSDNAVRLLDSDKTINQSSESSLVIENQNDIGSGSQSRSVRHLSGNNHRHLSGGGGGCGGDTSGGFSEEDTETDETDHERTLTNIASGLASMHGDFFFGDGEFDHVTTAYDYDYLPNAITVDGVNANAEDWTLPNEAFQPRHEIQTQSPPPGQFACISTVLANTTSNARGSGRGMTAAVINHHGLAVNGGAAVEQTLLIAKPEAYVVPMWDFTSLVAEMLHHYASQGDVQMSVSVIIVLGDRFKHVIDEQTQDQWFTSYIDLLTRFQLWTVSNQVIKLSWLPMVNMMNQQSTTVHTNCSKCLRQFQRVGWLCDRCKKLTNTCSVCHRVVKSLYVWCQGCCHGGHLQHIQDWLEESPWCPTGCGHMCEYT